MKSYATNYNVSNIYNQIVLGTLVVPSYQREYCWDKEKIELLIDSIENNICIGTFQFRRVYSMLSPTVHEIIDGQHRLRTLFNVLLGKGVYFNFDTCKFTLNSNDFDYGRFIKEVSNIVMIYKDVVDGVDYQDQIDLEKCKKIAKPYRKFFDTVLICIIYEGTDDEIKTAFDRINQKGVAFTPVFTQVESQQIFKL